MGNGRQWVRIIWNLPCNSCFCAIMLVRVQSRNGTKRITAAPTDTLRKFLDKVVSEFDIDLTTNFALFQSPAYRDELTQAHLSLQLSTIPIKHGDMLYLQESGSGQLSEDMDTESATGERSKGQLVEEDEVDKVLSKADGRIMRKKDPQLCHHGAHSKCINCVPLEPWDKSVQEGRDPPIKHLAFHCYIRKLTSGVDRGKFTNLEDISCKVKSGCVDHPPWPEGICTKCQPSAVYLARQTYRHVDNVMVDDHSVVDHFIEGWRRSGQQRIGYLIGQYQEYSDVPLGIRAVVSAIYEPPQVSGKYSVELLEDPHDNDVQQLTALLGLRKIGWIFTDLESEGNGKVAYKRNVHTHLLTAEECIMAADFQNQFPSPCRLSRSGYFGSKFVTVCVSGNENNLVDLTSYQVSNQCQSLVRDDCLVPTLDAPELGYIKESTSEQYVPDVFYKTKGEYGADETFLARPFPLYQLTVDLTTTTPLNPQPLFPGGKGHFPIENREIQDFNSLSRYINEQHGIHFLNYMSDFHLLYFLYTASPAGIDFKPYLPSLCEAIRHGDRAKADQWRKGDYWMTIEQLIRASSDHSPTMTLPPAATFPGRTVPDGGGANATPTTSQEWACQHCTFLNPAHLNECDVCHLPRTQH